MLAICYKINADGSDFKVSGPYYAEVVSSNGSNDSGSGSGSGIDPENENDYLLSCFIITIIGDSIVEDMLECIDVQVDFGDIFVDNVTLIILDDDSKFLYKWEAFHSEIVLGVIQKLVYIRMRELRRAKAFVNMS